MSLAADSPVHSSSSDDFAAFLDAELKSASTSEEEASPDQDNVSNDDDDNDDDYLKEARIKRRKVCESEVIDESQGSTSVGAMQEELVTSQAPIDEICPHPGFIRDMCIRCGKLKDDYAGVAFGYIHKDLKLGAEEIARLRGADLKNLLRDRKLYLVLDLDHTLLNSTRLIDTLPEENYLINQADPVEDGLRNSIFKLDHMHMLTKLRPYVHTFLKEASSMFEMYVYTMAERSYALEMAKLLDPGHMYFSSRIISQADCTTRHQKGLDVVLGAESAVVILDDTEIVWQKHKENLILMERYHFFASSSRQFGFNGRSLSELRRDESEADGVLAAVLKVLKRVHQMFFDPDDGMDVSSRDVRKLLSMVRREIFSGCKLVFSRVFPTKFQAENHQLWKMAEQLGATCSTELEPSVTHVVATDSGTEKARWAVQQGKFLVHPRWIEAAHYLWQRQPEEGYPVESQPKVKNLP
ncbi:RNA polymerase II C-terminal domain phosphatase-like 4 [Magnolia sinica]|uniref:RNA polymerase II C-terminal domain phosphatase-like 4 n=1 Tax=Magnolia sinica TaxID=86752 RepID=UPI00265A09DB|nr:RNA polymerase II C-terminal domain phosphatase-like 4 [Magnolia sinica]XP_058114100.1 RNA polymerase II C-terminal domain phosphatase-like 4 [Magnolia sinica]